jgi:hypothetical protein
VDVSVAVIAVITTIITTVAIIAVVVISSPLARLDLHGLALAARGARVAQRHMACGDPAAAGQSAWERTRARCHRHLAARRNGSGAIAGANWTDDEGPLLKEKRTSTVRCLKVCFLTPSRHGTPSHGF